MYIEIPNLWIILINAIGIPIAHLIIAWLFTILPATIFTKEPNQHSFLNIEKSGLLYNKIVHIRKWKNLLPDAAPWFKGFSKATLLSHDLPYLKTFVTETRRGEASHWFQLLIISAFTLWTPMPTATILIIYAIISNLPCILNLRYTRMRLLNVISRIHNPAN